MKIEINVLTWHGMDKLNRLEIELKEIREDKDKSFPDILLKEIEICKFLTTPNSEYAKKQIECEMNV